MKKTDVKKEISLDDLALMVAKGFAGMDKRFELIDERFEQIDTRFDKINEHFEQIKNETHELSEIGRATRRDVLEIGDRFVPRMELDNLLGRFNKLEEKVRTKLK